MQVVLFFVFGSLLVGYFYEKLDRRTIVALTTIVCIGLVAFMYVRRVL